jgi:hypothetical protein
MAMGSYSLGAPIKIPLQVTEGGVAETGNIAPTIKSLIKPDGTSEPGFPDQMSEIDSEYGTYFYEYTPETAGDYVVIITYTVDFQEYTALEYFTVSAKANRTTAPRAESR